VIETRVEVPGISARLSALRWDGGEPGFLLLHGAAGHAGEWREVGSWLARLGRVIALDLRGHGESERRPEAARLQGLLEDARVAATLFDRATVVVGQSLGGAVAIALAARAPEHVRAAVIVEASPSRDLGAAREVREWLDSWPLPFADSDEAERFFRGGQRGRAWADGLAETPAGLVPRFDPAVVEELVRAVTTVNLWDDWRRIACPVLVVRGGEGSLEPAEAERMAGANRRASVVTVESAGHDVHLDDPEAFRAAVEPFAAAAVR
jgi:pimeloyl-ACP methyl ester carboxylesterase